MPKGTKLHNRSLLFAHRTTRKRKETFFFPQQWICVSFSSFSTTGKKRVVSCARFNNLYLIKYQRTRGAGKERNRNRNRNRGRVHITELPFLLRTQKERKDISFFSHIKCSVETKIDCPTKKIQLSLFPFFPIFPFGLFLFFSCLDSGSCPSHVVSHHFRVHGTEFIDSDQDSNPKYGMDNL